MSTINLLPESYMRQRLRNRVNRVCIALLVVTLMCMFVAEVFSRRQNQGTRQLHAMMTARFQQAAGTMNEYFALQLRKKKLLAQLREADAKIDRLPRSAVLTAINNMRPDGVALTQLQLLETQVAPPVTDAMKARAKLAAAGQAGPPEEKPAPLPPRISVELNGLAERTDQITAFCAALRDSPLVRQAEVRHTTEDQKDGKTYRRFQIVLELCSEKDALDLPPAKTDAPAPQARATPPPTSMEGL